MVNATMAKYSFGPGYREGKLLVFAVMGREGEWLKHQVCMSKEPGTPFATIRSAGIGVDMAAIELNRDRSALVPLAGVGDTPVALVLNELGKQFAEFAKTDPVIQNVLRQKELAGRKQG